jgi:conjugal transfer pilus assembly protein TraV
MKTCIDKPSALPPLLCAALLSGCAGITGLDGSSDYACKAPEGVKCDSVSGTYYNAIQNNLPSQRKPAGTTLPSSPTDQPAPQGVLAVPVQNGPAARSASLGQPSPVPAAVGTATGAGGGAAGSAYLAAPLRSGPRVLRLWIKPWEDSDHDLNSESLVYVQVDNGRWLVDHVQRLAREPYAPVRPGRLPTSAGKDPSRRVREADAAPVLQPGPSVTGSGSPVTQALRSLQANPVGAADN